MCVVCVCEHKKGLAKEMSIANLLFVPEITFISFLTRQFYREVGESTLRNFALSLLTLRFHDMIKKLETTQKYSAACYVCTCGMYIVHLQYLFFLMKVKQNKSYDSIILVLLTNP